MIRRPAWIAIAIFILLAAFTLLLEKRGDDLPFSKTTPTPTVYQVVSHADADITKVSLLRDGHEISAIKDATLGWNFLSPPSIKDEAGTFQEKLSEILSFKVMRVLPTETTDILMGLENNPALKITIEYSDGQKDVISIGDPTPIESGYYARLQNGDAVILNKISVENVTELFTQFYPPLSTPETGAIVKP